MPKIISITESYDLANSIERFVRYNFALKCTSIVLPEVISKRNEEDISKIFDDYDKEKNEWIISIFQNLKNLIISELQTDLFNSEESIIIIQHFDIKSNDDCLVNIISPGPSWSAVVGMLILAFPEIHWILYTMHSCSYNDLLFRKSHYWKILEKDNDVCEGFRSAFEMHKIGYRPIFDPSGLRNYLKSSIIDNNGRSCIDDHREYISASIDDEEHYAYLNAYICYRFYYRAHVVARLKYMEMLFRKKSDYFENNINFEGTFEDLFLNFPDRIEKKSEHFSILEKRDDYFENLRNVRKRLFITSGNEIELSNVDKQKNIDYLENNEIDYEFINKPISGIFYIRKKAEFFFRKKFRKKIFECNVSFGHGAPGRLYIISECLLQRAEKCYKQKDTVLDSIHGALLSLEAKEILSGRTPTKSIEAISMLNYFEAKTESLFYGIDSSSNVASRIDKIVKDLNKVGIWFDPEYRHISITIAIIGVLNQLICVYRNYNSFDEEAEVLKYLRTFTRNLHFYKNLISKKNDQKNSNGLKGFLNKISYNICKLFKLPTSSSFMCLPKAYFLRFIEWYFHWLLQSWKIFAGVIIFWICFFWILFGFNLPHYSFISFFSMQPPIDTVPTISYQLVISMFEILLGFIHLGILISFLYYWIFRR
jgi:hypothetical protein